MSKQFLRSVLHNPPLICRQPFLQKLKNPKLRSSGKKHPKWFGKFRPMFPGISLVIPPVLESERVVMMVKVQGLGDYLPKYAGNMDIINCAAIAMAEEYAKKIGQLSAEVVS